LWDPVLVFGVSTDALQNLYVRFFYIYHTRLLNVCKERERERDVQFCNSDCHELKPPVPGSIPEAGFPEL